MNIFENNLFISFLFYSNWQTFAHFLKASIGTGVLAMPSAFANAGYINGFILTVIIGAIAVYCLHILVKFCKPPNNKDSF